MNSDGDRLPADANSTEPGSAPVIPRHWLDRTPARLFAGRAGTSYSTQTLLSLRIDHAAALDAVRAEVDAKLLRDLDLETFSSRAPDAETYLLRPELGRSLDPAARVEIASRYEHGTDLQICVGDGLSAAAVDRQVPRLLPLLLEGARSRSWRCGRPFFIRRCRVGILNEIGETLDPRVVLLLIGERPGLATAESLSAYLAHRPRVGCTDADRNLISNIHDRGSPPEAASRAILDLVARMMEQGISGVALKEPPPPPPSSRILPPSEGRVP
ncbi:MAG: ethanolamine ammonia-lyase subunit EutC [Isosphaeraceae bacterium]|nr:ethanolamine ammonia-lyase subunit EutC [Isosphaeraceae bacterium]